MYILDASLAKSGSPSVVSTPKLTTPGYWYFSWKTFVPLTLLSKSGSVAGFLCVSKSSSKFFITLARVCSGFFPAYFESSLMVFAWYLPLPATISIAPANSGKPSVLLLVTHAALEVAFPNSLDSFGGRVFAVHPLSVPKIIAVLLEPCSAKSPGRLVSLGTGSILNSGDSSESSLMPLKIVAFLEVKLLGEASVAA